MNNLAEISFHFNIQTEEKLRCLNDVINRIDSWSEHQFWCGGEIPFKANIDRFEPGTEPIASWVARTPSGEQIAYLETYNTWHGRILARLWVDPDFRRLGIRPLHPIAKRDQDLGNARHANAANAHKVDRPQFQRQFRGIHRVNPFLPVLRPAQQV